MCGNNKFYICEHCGNLIGMILDAGVPMMCCGQKMTKLEPGVVEASHEKHIPVVSIEGNRVTVTIGSIEHPENGIAPGTLFDELPDDFECPLCGVGKDNFSEAE